MSVSPIASSAPQVQPNASLEAKRALLQSAMLKKALDMQNQQTQLQTQEIEGKGQILDIRV